MLSLYFLRETRFKFSKVKLSLDLIVSKSWLNFLSIYLFDFFAKYSSVLSSYGLSPINNTPNRGLTHTMSNNIDYLASENLGVMTNLLSMYHNTKNLEPPTLVFFQNYCIQTRHHKPFYPNINHTLQLTKCTGLSIKLFLQVFFYIYSNSIFDNLTQ